MEQYKQVLKKYLPAGTEDIIVGWLQRYRIHLHVSRSRVTKLGDFRPPLNGEPNRITINYNLNPYSFLITLVHEIAHVEVWLNYKNRVKPHGREWKKLFGQKLDELLDACQVPGDIEKAMRLHAKRPLASSGADLALARVLKKYDDEQGLTLEELPANALFSIHNGKKFKKLDKGTKRYRCLRLDNKKIYMVHPMTQVILLENG